MVSVEQRIIAPVKIDKTGPLYKRSDVDKAVIGKINSESHFKGAAKIMTTDAEKAIKITENVIEQFSKTLDRFNDVEATFIAKSKKSAGEVKDASERLAQGIARVEKAANFDRLEKYVQLLERAASAMTMLAELEKSGKLDKIASAIR